MNSTLTALVVFGCLVGAVFVGRTLRRLLPEDHLSAESRDAVKLAMGLVATMSALVLGLLVSSAKGCLRHRTKRGDSDGLQGHVPRPGAGRLRTGSCRRPRAASRDCRGRDSANVAWRNAPAGERLAPNAQAANAVYGAIQPLSPHNDMQAALKSQAASLAVDTCSGSVTSGSPVGSLDIEADVDHTCLMARHHFPWLQRARAAKRYDDARLDGLCACRLRRYFPDPGVG